MESETESSSGQLRWQYLILWRYGALGLAAVGLILMGLGASDVSGNEISLALLPLGFACLVGGVVLPRIEGKFTAGTSGVSAELVAVHKLDTLTYIATAPVLAAAQTVSTVCPDGADNHALRRVEPVRLGDVWDALEGAGFHVVSAATGKRLLEGPEGRSIMLHGRELLGWAIVSNDLLAQLASWRIAPAASGMYVAPPGTDVSRAPYSGVPLLPMLRESHGN